jgi:lantibiotic biosynthesis protein
MRRPISGDAYLDAALRLGRDLAAGAVWSGERCSWVGGMPDEGPGGIVMTYRSFGPDLYGGTAGVGLVLAELFDAGGGSEPELRRTALGALRHGLSRAAEVAASQRLGFYAGQLGIALCAARAGLVLEEPSLGEGAAEIVASLDYEAEPLENDLIAGRAGGIVALLALRALGVEEARLELAAGLGNDLLAVAQRTGAGLSWPAPSSPGQRNLTGLSHGAAGIGLALLELANAGGGDVFREAAAAAFAYERALYDPRARNWPDLREHTLSEWPSEAAPPCSTLWCHGAPGIAVARLRARELGSANGCEEEAGVALETTAAAVRAQLGTGNYSLCHGLAGNAEVLLEGADLLAGDVIALAHEVGDDGIERYLETGTPWPFGVFEGETDSLLVGRAGTAYFYLRLHDPARPSLLIPRPEAFA